MLNSYINKITHNSNDFGIGVVLPTITIEYKIRKKSIDWFTIY